MTQLIKGAKFSVAKKAVSIPLILTALLWAGTSSALSEHLQLRDGAYEVEVRLELPNLQNVPAKSIARVCISSNDKQSFGFTVLSKNNPLSNCPSKNLSIESEKLTFDIVCKGQRAAEARATYTLGVGRFHGRIDMKMGGKNMTMMETQSGRWIGDCDGVQ